MIIRKYMTIGRSIDPRYPTNRAIAIISLLVMVGAAAAYWQEGIDASFLMGETLANSMKANVLGALGSGLEAGLAIFLAWALGRELDPDHDYSAFVGVALMLLALPFVRGFGLLGPFAMLMGVRVVNRSVGLPLTVLDSLLVFGLATWAAFSANWVHALIIALAFLLDSQLARPNQRSMSFVGVSLIPAIVAFTRPTPGLSTATIILTLLAGLLFAGLVVRTAPPSATVGDATREPLDSRRVQMAQGLALLAAAALALLAGDAGVIGLLPLWAAICGVALYRPFA